MCGIFGAYSPKHFTISDLHAELVRGMSFLERRGPDGNGAWINDGGYIGFAHTRLSIIELTELGKQPRKSKNNRFHITYNGEIYNHTTIREQLQKEFQLTDTYWDSGSDTETLIEALSLWGVKKTLQSINGMFAFALWDELEQSLCLARDRVGEKPLYFGWLGSSLYFSSDLSAFKASKSFNNPISPEALDLYTQFNYVPAPYSIFQNIYKLQPGTFIQFQYGASPSDTANFPIHNSSKVQSEAYWSFEDVISSRCLPIQSLSDAIESVETALYKAIASQTISDVPLGAFLSGGIDSSLIVALLSKVQSSPTKTYTIGFHEDHLNEAPYAKKVAQHLGTDHTELYIHADDMRDVIPDLPSVYSEPFADSSQIPTLLVSKLAVKNVTVALSGDAGDELFGGYNRYFWSKRIWSKLAWMPLGMRQTFGIVIARIPTHRLDVAYKVLTHFLPQKFQVNQFGHKLSKLGNRLRGVSSLEDLYLSLVREWQLNDCLSAPGPVNSYVLNNNLDKLQDLDIRERMMFWDSISYLPDDILCKVDRAAMYNSLETRCPFLDPGVIKAAWDVSLDLKFKNNAGKYILKAILEKHLPKELFERPKAGFAIPIGDWLRSSMKPWAEELLSEKRIREDGLFDSNAISTAWNAHLDGKDSHNALWSILMFNSWADHFRG
jgi:asparagine synthase (glutamine-hydrolysing)